MNIEEYIASGILEAYALGELSDAERADVAAMVARHPEVKEELMRIERAQEQLLMRAAIAPPLSARAAVLGRVHDETPVIPLQARPSMFWKYAAAASVVLALTSSYLAYTYWQRWRNTEKSLSELIAQNQRVAQDYNQVNLRLNKLEEDLRITTNPAFRRVVMNGTPQSPQALASVYWNEQTQEVYLRIQSLKTVSAEQQFQLWAIVDGKPVDAGVFDGNLDGLMKMKSTPGQAAAFAVTVEPRGGRPTPSLETMQVVGNVIKG